MFRDEINERHSSLVPLGGAQPLTEEMRSISAVAGRPFSGQFHRGCSCVSCVTARLLINLTRRKMLLEDLTEKERSLIRFSGFAMEPVEAQTEPLTHSDIKGGNDKLPKTQYWFVYPKRKRTGVTYQEVVARMDPNPRRQQMEQVVEPPPDKYVYSWADAFTSYGVKWNAAKSMRTLLDEYIEYLNSCPACGKGVDPMRRTIITDVNYRHSWRLCERCLKNKKDKLFACSFCGTAAVADNASSLRNADDRGYKYCCVHCTKHANFCEQCHQYYITDFCDKCNRAAGLHRHNYTPRFQPLLTAEESLDYTKLMTGIEIEMGTRMDHDPHIMARDINAQTGLYAVHDGSITRENREITRGIELVTMPFTQAYWHETLKPQLEQLIKELKSKYDLEAYNQFSCGFHIHLSRAAFTPARLYKLIYLMTKNSSWTYKIGQRDEDNWTERYCSFNKEAKTTKDLIDKACGYPGDPLPPLVDNRFGGGDGDPHKYVAINTTGNKSIELRMFKGTLNMRAIQKNLEFAWAVYDWAGTASNSELNIPHFLDFVRRRQKMYPLLFEYLRALRQYPGIKGDSFLPLYQGD